VVARAAELWTRRSLPSARWPAAQFYNPDGLLTNTQAPNQPIAQTFYDAYGNVTAPLTPTATSRRRSCSRPLLHQQLREGCPALDGRTAVG